MGGNKRKGVIIFSAIIIIFAVLMTGLVIYAENIEKAFKQPSIENAVLDIEGLDLDENYACLILKGEWEFFYNKWIITDNMTDAEPDGMIKVQSRWSGKVFNGERLSREGYASYRMVVKNAPAGEELICTLGMYPNAYRIFINGVLCTSSGTVSKNVKETFAKAHFSYTDYYTVSEGEDLVIVVEISANKNGGLIYWPVINTHYHFDKTFDGNSSFGNKMVKIAIGFIIPVFFVVVILNNLHIYQKKNNSILLMIGALLLKFIFSFDIFYKITEAFTFIDYRLIHLFTYLTCFTLYLALLNVLQKHNILVTCNKKKCLFFLGLNVVAGLLYMLSYGSMLMFVFLSVPYVSMLYFLYQVCLAVAEKRKFAISYLILVIFVYINFVLDAGELTGLVLVNIAGITSIGSMIVMLTVLMVYLVQIKDRIEESRKAQVLEKEIIDVKNQALKAQIKPHFVFNMLTNIQDQYHKNRESGDSALTKFSKHLRLNVDSEYKDMVSFEEELDNIQNYFDLENIRREGKLNLLYDIEYTDFKLPILSLQPLVENAVKYAKTDEKEDGYIQIRSYQENGSIVIEVNDNGIGFDPSVVRQNATGLKNVIQRLKYSLDAEVTIHSKKSEGTTIKIVISGKNI